MIILLMKYGRSVIKEQLFGYVRMVAQLCKNDCSVIEETVFPKLKNGQYCRVTSPCPVLSWK